MYVLTVSVNGETVRSDAYASVVDATDDYAAATEVAPFSLPTDADRAAHNLTQVADVHAVSATWDVPNVASDAGEGPTDSDTYTVRLARVSSADVEVDGVPVTTSRAVILPTDDVDPDGHATADAINAAIHAAEIENAENAE